MQIKLLNIKENMPPADVAVCELELEIEALNNSNYGAIKVIHGYGSHGVGGEIKKLLNIKLLQLKHMHKILDFIPGEKWSNSVIKKYDIVKYLPELMLDSDLKNYNNGLTIVLLNNYGKN